MLAVPSMVTLVTDTVMDMDMVTVTIAAKDLLNLTMVTDTDSVLLLIPLAPHLLDVPSGVWENRNVICCCKNRCSNKR